MNNFIKQINSVGTNTYTIVKTDNYVGELENHPIFTEIPDTFEISENELPNFVQHVIYNI